MDVGLTIPTRGPLAAPDKIETLVHRAEELGFDHLSVSDHLVVPRNIDVPVPLLRVRGVARRRLGRMPRAVHAVGLARRDHQQAPTDHRGRGHPLSGCDAHREDRGDDRRALAGAPGPGRRRRLDEGGVRSGRRAAVRRARPRHRRVPAGLQDPVDRERSSFRGPPRALRRDHVPAQTGAEAAPADLGRRREPARAAPYRTLRRRLVPDRQQPAPSARHGRALQGRRRKAPSGGGAEQP